MIVFKTLSWKNFLSTGIQKTVIQLDKSPTTLILGANGSGKSTMLDALCYALFKKPFRKINKDQIINTINGGDCEVCVEFEIGTKQYKVTRGIKPDKFELLIDGNPRPLDAAKKDDQAFLEEDVLKFDFDAFTQVAILGNAKYTPFMQLAAGKRREFIEHILDIGVFSLMNKVLKTKRDTLEDDIAANAKDILSAQEQVSMVAGFITKLEAEQKKANEDTQQQLDQQTAAVKELSVEVEALESKEETLSLRISETTSRIHRESEAQRKQIEQEYSQRTAALQKTCSQDVQVARKEVASQIANIDEKLDADIAEQEEQKLDPTPLETKLRKLEGYKTTIQSNLASAQATVEFYTTTTTCKVCRQEIDPALRDSIVTERTEKIAEFQDGLAKLELQLESQSTALIDAKAHNKAIANAVAKLTADARTAKDALNQAVLQKIDGFNTKAQSEIRALNSQSQKEQNQVLSEATQRSKDETAADVKEQEQTAAVLRDRMAKLASAKILIKKLEADLKRTPGNVQEQKDKLVKLEAKLAGLTSRKEAYIERKHYYEVSAILLKDSGIKAAIIKQYLPVINRMVNKHLADLDFFLLFNLDENFKESFKSRHRDNLQYYSFSEGEKLRIDLALLFTWREIARMKNSCATNLLILDEVIDSSLDGNGTDNFIKMLNALGGAQNVFVISHKDQAQDKFTDLIRFEKRANFSHRVEQV